MNIYDYFNPVDNQIIEKCHFSDAEARLISIDKYESKKTIRQTEQFDIAIIGVPEDRNSRKQGSAMAPDAIRTFLYSLYKPVEKINIVDLGNLKISRSVNNTIFGLRDIVIFLLQNNVIPLIIGGTKFLNYACYKAYEALEKRINIVSINSKVELAHPAKEPSFIAKIIEDSGKYLFNFTNLAYQSYLSSPREVELLEDLHFDAVRLGQVQSKIMENEPIIRDADILSFDINAIKQSEAPAQNYPSPNGLYSAEACQLAKYAGLSDRLSCFGIYEVIPENDRQQQTAHLAAQIVWHFIEGVYQRKNDYPAVHIDKHTKFIVRNETIGHDLIFYKSTASNRWWFEIPYNKPKHNRKMIFACSYSDYETACKHEIPEKWWKYYQKLN